MNRIARFALAALAALPVPAAAMVGGAKPADGTIARAAVVIVGSRGNFCTGAALARDLVLTAAHCVLPGALYKLVEYDAARKPTLRDVASVTLHPQFKLQDLTGHRATADVALVKLAQPLAAVALAVIDAAPPRPAPGDRFTVVGAGVTRRGDGSSGGVARTADLVATGKPGTLQIRLMDQATRGAFEGLGACTGDSGAPVFRDADGRPVLTGVVSWSTGPNASAGCGGLTGVTPLALYRGWIVDTAAKLGARLP